MVRKYMSPNPWETTDVEALVPLSTHQLHVSTSGPPRSPGAPVVLFFSGGGAPCAAYMRLQRLLSQHLRVYFHDRAGYGYSEVGPGDQQDRQDRAVEEALEDGDQQAGQARRALADCFSGHTKKKLGQPAASAAEARVPLLTAQQAATELSELLGVIQVGPPYILVGHSYGGICARAFLALLSASSTSPSSSSSSLQDVVAGMVLPETASEILYTVLPHVPPAALEKITADVDYEAATHLRARSRLTDEEWEHILALVERTAARSRGEDPRLSAWRLLRSQQQYLRRALGAAPLSVVRADLVKEFRLLFEAAVGKGNGTDEERGECRAFLETAGLFDDEMRMGQLRLSTGPTRYRRELDHGHALPITGPEVVVEEVLWVLDRWRESREVAGVADL